MSAPARSGSGRRRSLLLKAASAALGGALVLTLTLPLLGLLLSLGAAQASGLDPSHGRESPLLSAILVSLRTSSLALALIVLGGIPLAWWLSRGRSLLRSFVGVCVDLPVVLPPAVVGVGLLLALGRGTPLGDWLAERGLEFAFTGTAVVLAQVVVGAPFFVRTAAAAFRRLDADTLALARSLGAGPGRLLARVILPLAWPGVLAGAALAWARALGEFGATLLFAGNREGVTRTLPLAIADALEVDTGRAVLLALVAASLSLGLLLALRALPRLLGFEPEPEPAPTHSRR